MLVTKKDFSSAVVDTDFLTEKIMVKIVAFNS